jgi:MscS family membrane protein
MPELEQIEQYLSQTTGENPYVWFVQIVLILCVIIVLHTFARLFFDRLESKTNNSKTPWDDVLVAAVRRPVRLLIWQQGILFMLYISTAFVPDNMHSVIPLFQKVSLVWLIALFLLKLVSGFERVLQDPSKVKKPLDVTTANAISQLLRISLLIVATLVMLQSIGVSISGILAFGGIGGIAVGFAAKDLLANFFGGLMIYLDRPFKVGDWIRSPNQEIEGTVEYIGWRTTRIRTFDKRPLYVPNSIFANIAVENPSRMENRRIKETFSVRYSDSKRLNKIIEDVKAMLISHPEIASDLTLIVNVDKFSASSIDFFVYTFTKTTDWVDFHEIKHEIMLLILAIIESNEAECAYPTQTLFVEK